MKRLLASSLGDLSLELPANEREQRMVERLRTHFRCGAVALLCLDTEGEVLRPIAVDGLSADVLGRRFVVREHPRLAAILGRTQVIRFPHDSPLPDPYDGLVIERPGEPLHVHDCMGVTLRVEGRARSVLTLDALRVGTFDSRAQQQLVELLPVLQATVRVGGLEAALRFARQAGGWSLARSPALGEDWAVQGQSEAMAELLHELGVVADTELPVLLLGETGVGKEMLAHGLHAQSRRRDRALVHVNCAALPEALAESELFGHVRGAFAGALKDRPGRFVEADGGSLLLHEVSELPLSVQAKLLHALQHGEIHALGAAEAQKVDVRVIASTNRDLRELVRQGSFRADLYHRLSVYPLHVPPLRERGDDVLLLAGGFLEANRARLGLRGLRLGTDAKRALRRYPWPGNVRELEQVIGRAALKAVSRGASRTEVVTLDASVLDLEDNPRHLAEPGEHDLVARWRSRGSLRERVEQSQLDAIAQAMEAHDGRWAAAARELEVDPSNLQKLARRLGYSYRRRRA